MIRRSLDADGATPQTLYPLDVWLRALAPAAATHGGVLTASLEAATALLADPREVAVLHGDLQDIVDAAKEIAPKADADWS